MDKIGLAGTRMKKSRSDRKDNRPIDLFNKPILKKRISGKIQDKKIPLLNRG